MSLITLCPVCHVLSVLSRYLYIKYRTGCEARSRGRGDHACGFLFGHIKIKGSNYRYSHGETKKKYLFNDKGSITN